MKKTIRMILTLSQVQSKAPLLLNKEAVPRKASFIQIANKNSLLKIVIKRQLLQLIMQIK